MIGISHTSKTKYGLLCLLFLLVLSASLLTSAYYLLAIPFVVLLAYAGWSSPGIVFCLLLLFLPFSFEYNFTPTLGTDIPDEGLMLLTAILFAGYWLYDPSTISGDTWKHPLLVLLLLHFSWIIIITMGSHNLLASIKYVVAKSWYIAAFTLAGLIFFRNKKSIRAAVLLLGFAMLAIAIVALVRHGIDGFSFAGVNKSVDPFFRNHVNYSAMLVCIIPLFFALFGLSRRFQTRLLVIAAITILVTALFFSYARGAWLAFALGCLAYWLVKKKLLVVSFVTIILLSLATLFWLKSGDRYLRYAHDFKTTIYHKEFREHLVATYQLKDVSTAERFYRWIAGVRMIKENWLTGYGPSTFYEQYKPYAVPAYKTWVSDNKERSTVHNYFLLLAIEQGLPGLIFFLVLLGAMLFYAQRVHQRASDQFYKTASMTIAVMLVMIITVNCLSDLIETDKIGSLFFLCLAALIRVDIMTRKDVSRQLP